jgi:hypothetical protein
MEIEYLERFKKLCKPKKGQKEIDATMHRFKARHGMCREYSFAIPTAEAIREVAKLSPLIEIGAGSGYWASLLEKSGATVEAFDKFPKENKYKFTKTYTNIKTADEKILKDFPENYNLFLCWPNYDNDFAYKALSLFKGDKLAYIGEGEGGCTGNDQFHGLLKHDWEEIKSINIPQWDGIHDRLTIYQRKTK